MADADRTTHLAGLAPGVDVDYRGTPFTEPLLRNLLRALHDPATGKPRFGNARFDGATFSGVAGFDGATFSGIAGFAGAQFMDHAEFSLVIFAGPAGFARAGFRGPAGFSGTTFKGVGGFTGATFSTLAGFAGATFSGPAEFDEVAFTGAARFGRVSFTGPAGFVGARFLGPAEFDRAAFTGAAKFDRATFTGPAGFCQVEFSSDVRFGDATFALDAAFREANFPSPSTLGPMTCAGRVDLSDSAFGAPAILEIAAAEVQCVRTRWDSTATLRLRYASVNLSQAVLAAPVALTTSPRLTATRHIAEETLLGDREPSVKVTSVQGVDAAHLVLTDTDLSDCLFIGAFHLDQLRLEGSTTFAPVPTGTHLRHHFWPYRWTQRRCLAEEHHWRAHTAGQSATLPAQSPSPHQWRTAPHDHAHTPAPQHVVPVYRQLRKAFEDNKNEPGAADFYYGEMEMRRHDRNTPRAERGLLFAYWLLSGYGLRASRALSWLLAAMTTTVLLLMLWGLPDQTPTPATTGTLAHGRLTLRTTTSDPALTRPWQKRLTADRAEQATRVVLNSVIFRTSDQNLTTAGTYIEMASRLLEPILLALAALAARGRIKR
nr:pentapeptide repeat-containing protein [Streptomyces cyanogenus]